MLISKMVCSPLVLSRLFAKKTHCRTVSDRLAYLNFVHGALSETLANNLDKSRATLKTLRDAENALAPKRTVRANLETQIGKIEYEQPRGQERRLAEMKQQLKAAEAEDATAEREIEILKRKALRESEKLKWAAVREVSGWRVLVTSVIDLTKNVLSFG